MMQYLYNICLGPSFPCQMTQHGVEYGGYVSQTKTGKTCQRWDSQSPHEHTRNDIAAFPDLTLQDAANFCRNPDKVSSFFF